METSFVLVIFCNDVVYELLILYQSRLWYAIWLFVLLNLQQCKIKSPQSKSLQTKKISSDFNEKKAPMIYFKTKFRGVCFLKLIKKIILVYIHF